MEIGGLEVREMKREKWEAYTTDHNQTHSAENDMCGAITESKIELLNG